MLAIVSLVVLAVAIVARYPQHLAGVWRPIYAVAAVLAFYLNFFVLIVQSFMKVPALNALAPTQTEMPFKIAQLVTLVIFAVLTVLAAIKFRDKPVQAT